LALASIGVEGRSQAICSRSGTFTDRRHGGISQDSEVDHGVSIEIGRHDASTEVHRSRTFEFDDERKCGKADREVTEERAPGGIPSELKGTGPTVDREEGRRPCRGWMSSNPDPDGPLVVVEVMFPSAGGSEERAGDAGAIAHRSVSNGPRHILERTTGSERRIDCCEFFRLEIGVVEGLMVGIGNFVAHPLLDCTR
jgi:hypothetical protein